MTEITLPFSDADHLFGVVALTGTPYAVVYVHGFGSDIRGEKPRAVFAACARRGWSCAAFEFRGHGRSSGRMTDLRASGLLKDLDAVRDYLAQQGVRELYLVGSSMGGFASSWFALRHPESVRGMALIAPAFGFLQRRWEALSPAEQRHWREAGTIRYRNQWLDAELDIGLMDERDDFAMNDLAERWRTPALLFHGMRDETVSWQDSLTLVEKAAFADMQLRLLKDGDHRLQAYKDEMAESACEFFARWVNKI